MLFDLRSRGRQRTVRVVYLFLALLMGAGLVLFGVGAGNGFGGILNAFTGNGSSGAQKQAISQQEQAALKATEANPNDASAWAQLAQARWSSAGQTPNIDASTGAFTASGVKELQGVTSAWERYIALTKSPDFNTAVIAGRSYVALNQYSGAASAWEQSTVSEPNFGNGYVCMAYSAFAAGQTRKGQLATAKATPLLPNLQAAQTKQLLNQAKTSKQSAQQLAQQNCGPPSAATTT